MGQRNPDKPCAVIIQSWNGKQVQEPDSSTRSAGDGDAGADRLGEPSPRVRAPADKQQVRTWPPAQHRGCFSCGYAAQLFIGHFDGEDDDPGSKAAEGAERKQGNGARPAKESSR